MAGPKYQQLACAPDADEDVVGGGRRAPAGGDGSRAAGGSSASALFQRRLLSLALILLYFTLSIGLTFYQRWLLKDFHYPLTVVMYHLVVKWVLAAGGRAARGRPAAPLAACLRCVAPVGLASGIDVGFSNWGLELVTVSLYTMAKSTTIVFILAFATLLGLERKSWSLAGIVASIAAGLAMFTYKATQFSAVGFALLLAASLAAGARWTLAQLLAQRGTLGLHDPLDMVFHVQPWMFLALLPFAVAFEGWGCAAYLRALPGGRLAPALLKVSAGAGLAFAMEVSEYLVVTYTSSLTLSVAGIFKEMCILTLAVEVSGDRLSAVNACGLAVCLLGVAAHVARSARAGSDASGGALRGAGSSPPSPSSDECDEPLLEKQWAAEAGGPREGSDGDSGAVLEEVVQRRGGGGRP